MIDQLVDNSQSFFVKGRYIMENVVIVEEIISNLQKRNINDNVVKVDFIKAFNFVDWDFLFELLEARGFSACWIR